MNKIFLILVLIASSYGQANTVSRMGVGGSSCSVYLDVAENKDDQTFYLFGSYAQGAFAIFNEVSSSKLLPNNKSGLFEPKASSLRRVLMKHCEENLTEDFHEAVIRVWYAYAK